MTFTVQQELADRMVARPGGSDYGPVSVLVSLLASLTLGSALPASAFWPAPKVTGRIVRIDFDQAAAQRVVDLDLLTAVLALSFGQRRKQIGSIVRRKDSPFPPDALAAALAAAGIDPTLRPEQVTPEAFAALAAALDNP